MKGQEDIIAVVLILMVTIALTALAYMWFSGIFSGIMATVTTALTRTSGAMATQFKIENAVFNITENTILYVTIRNVGSQSFNANKVAFYVNDLPKPFVSNDCLDCDCDNLEEGCIANYNVTATGLSTESKLRATTETGLETSKEIIIIS